jgi:hypothetical protein
MKKEDKEEERGSLPAECHFTPPKMNFIFKSILDNGSLFKIHLQFIKETILEAIESNNREAPFYKLLASNPW